MWALRGIKRKRDEEPSGTMVQSVDGRATHAENIQPTDWAGVWRRTKQHNANAATNYSGLRRRMGISKTSEWAHTIPVKRGSSRRKVTTLHRNNTGSKQIYTLTTHSGEKSVRGKEKKTGRQVIMGRMVRARININRWNSYSTAQNRCGISFSKPQATYYQKFRLHGVVIGEQRGNKGTNWQNKNGCWNMSDVTLYNAKKGNKKYNRHWTAKQLEKQVRKLDVQKRYPIEYWNGIPDHQPNPNPMPKRITAFPRA